MQPLPETPAELGTAMRYLRQGRALRDIAKSGLCKDTGISKSSLSRYERGLLPPLRLAKLLSDLYGGDGWLEIAIRNLWAKDWDPWKTEYPQYNHIIKWPASFNGRVWIHVMPSPHSINKTHSMILSWGPWYFSYYKVLPKEGICLSTGKAEDQGCSVPCMIETDLPVHILHGTGKPDNAIDISRLWRQY